MRGHWKKRAIGFLVVPAKLWKLDALLRLLLSVVVCGFAGSFLITGLNQAGATPLDRVRITALTVCSIACLGTTVWLLHKSWRATDGLKRAAVLVGLFYAGLLLGAYGAKLAGPQKPSVLQMIVSALSLQGAMVLLLGGFLKEHETNWAEAFGLKQRWKLALVAGILLAFAVVPVAWMLQDLSGRVMKRFYINPELQQVVQTLGSQQSGMGRLVFAAMTLFLAPVAEEAFFRGLLYPWLKALGHQRLALWGTSLAFALIHFNMAGFVSLTLLALALAMIYELTGNLLAPITAHAVFNAANLARLYMLENA